MERIHLHKNQFKSCSKWSLVKIILVLICIQWDAVCASHITQSENTTVFNLNHVYTGSVDIKHGNYYRFNLDQNLNSRYRLRVHVLHPINETSLRYPLQVSSEPTSRFSLFSLPYEIDDDLNLDELFKSQFDVKEGVQMYNYHVGAERTLCITPNSNEGAVITIKFHTSSWFPFNYKFVLMHDAEMMLNNGLHVSAPSLSSSTFYKRYWNGIGNVQADKIDIQVVFPLPPPQTQNPLPPLFLREDEPKKLERFKRNSNYRIQTQQQSYHSQQSQLEKEPLHFSDHSAAFDVDIFCLKISIKKLDCPVDADSENYEFQTMIFSSGVLTIMLSRDFMDGFILLVQPHASEEKCSSMMDEDQTEYLYGPVKWTETENPTNYDPWWNHKTFYLEQIPSTLMNPMHFFVGLNVSSVYRRWNPYPPKRKVGLKTTTIPPLSTNSTQSSTLPPTSLTSTTYTKATPIFKGLNTSTTSIYSNTKLPSNVTIGSRVIKDPLNSTEPYTPFLNPTLSLIIPTIVSILLLIVALISITILVQPLYKFHLPLTRQMSTRSANEKASYAKALRPANKCSTFFILVTFYTVPLYHFTDFFVKLPDLIKNNMCTPNSGCTFSLGQIQDFNHLLSNIPYVLLGLGFYFCVQIVENALVTFAQKEASQAFVDVNENRYHTDFEKVDESFLDFQNLLRSTANTSPVYSSPTSTKSGPREARDVVTLAAKMVARFLVSFGIFRALAVAMVMEGLLSATFSICPNHNTYKFDNGFLIYLAILIIFKFYHYRHIRVFNELQTIGLLGVVKIVLVIGAVFEGFLGSNIYFMGTTFIITFAIILVASFYYRQSQDNVYSMQERVLFPLIMIITSGGVMAFWFAFEFTFAQYFLYQVTLCSLAYRIFYGFMKVCHSEFRGNGAIGHFLYVGLWCFNTALIVYIFSGASHTTLGNMSVFKENSKDCITWLPNHDVDDIVRVLSAVVMFVSLFDLILVDDYVLTTPKSKIRIF